ncbi:MAG TPA: hypothetical protein VKU41_01975, partial [Polyangiaceae bacterium]|nr:hypothetical protein [Polyangiaceae bacterium]
VTFAACGGATREPTGRSREPTSGHAARLLLTAPVLTRLQARASANDPAWTALKTHCDGLVTGTANVPSGNAYPNFPDVGQGYQGDGYLPEVLDLGLCYQTIAPTDATTAASYAAAGDRVLLAMSTSPSAGGQAPSTDSGYGIRNYGVGMAFGFDWLYPGLPASTRATVIASLSSWVDWYDASGFSNDAPIGNYFAGYILAKTATAIATDPDNSKAAGYWSDVQGRMFPALIQAIYAPSMTGGGWPEGWEYGPRSVENYSLFFWAVKTGKGLDWFSQIPAVRDEAAYMNYFAWPSLKHMDDQGTIHSGITLTPPGTTAAAMAGMLAANGDPAAPIAQAFAADLLATNHDAMAPWQSFLYWDPSQAQSAYSAKPLSYFAPGPNHVAVRSTWQKDAVWGSFVPGTYIDSTDSGEQSYNAGAVAVVQGDQPILANATGQLPQVDGTAGENLVYADSYGSGTRQLFNTFGATGIKQAAFGPGSASAHAQGYEDNGTFVHARGVQLEQMYEPAGVVSQWTRDFAYVRPGVFVVYDRSTTKAADNWVSWHTAVSPTRVTTSDGTQRRFDVTGGSIRMLLPENPNVNIVAIAAGITRLETHSSNASEDFLTVVTAGATPDQVRLSTSDGNVTVGSLVGVHVLQARNAVVLFNADHAAAAKTSNATYRVAQSAAADHVLFDMAASSSGYSVTATAAGGQISVNVQPGGSLQPSAQGSLAFVVNTDGSVTANGVSISGGSSSGGSSSGGSSSRGSSGGVVVPPGGGANLLSDPGFESGANGFKVWPGGSTPALTTKAIDGTSSMLVALTSSGQNAFLSLGANGAGAVHATAQVRNDGAATANVKTCAGIYDQNWNSQYSCTSVSLVPGAVTPLSVEYVIPSGTTALMTNWFFAPTTGGATFAVDDAYLGYAPN